MSPACEGATARVASSTTIVLSSTEEFCWTSFHSRSASFPSAVFTKSTILSTIPSISYNPAAQYANSGQWVNNLYILPQRVAVGWLNTHPSFANFSTTLFTVHLGSLV